MKLVHAATKMFLDKTGHPKPASYQPSSPAEVLKIFKGCILVLYS